MKAFGADTAQIVKPLVHNDISALMTVLRFCTAFESHWRHLKLK